MHQHLSAIFWASFVYQGLNKIDRPLAVIQNHRCPDVFTNKCLGDTRLGLMEFFSGLWEWGREKMIVKQSVFQTKNKEWAKTNKHTDKKALRNGRGHVWLDLWVIRLEKKKEGLWGLFCRILNPTEDFKQRRNTDLCSGNAVLVSLRRIDWKWEKLERNMEVR